MTSSGLKYTEEEYSDKNAASHLNDKRATNRLENCTTLLANAYSKSQTKREAAPQYGNIQRKRSTLPVFQHRTAVCSLVNENQIILISGETGVLKQLS